MLGAVYAVTALSRRAVAIAARPTLLRLAPRAGALSTARPLAALAAVVPAPKQRATQDPAPGQPTVAASDVTFADLPLAPALRRCLTEDLDYQKPFGVQAATWPTTLRGSDVIVRAVTGSGKTLAFVLPIVQRLAFGLLEPTAAPVASRPPRVGGAAAGAPRALVLAPTRELALQVQGVLASVGRAVGLRSVAVYGGANLALQARDLRADVDVVVGTPGRINDFIERGDLRLDQVEVLGAWVPSCGAGP